MAASFRSAYQEDSDADDEYERSVITSPMLPPDHELSPTDSEPPSAEHTPTTFTHSADSYASPKGIITSWTPEQVADWISSLGLGQYARTFLEENVDGDALIALQHAELKEMGINSVGHRLTVLKGVYEVKTKHNVPIEPDHYVPLSAETTQQETAPTQDDFARIIQIIKDRDDRIHSAEAELRALKEDLLRMADENRKLREDVLPVVREAKNRSQPLPTPDAQEHHITSPPTQERERAGSSLSRKFSTKKLFLGDRDREPPLSGGRNAETASIAPSTAGTARGESSNPQVEIFKSFRVSIDDPCHKVLPVALKKYNITADWRQYALYIVHGDQERCLGLNERPLILFKQLDREGRKPMFMLRKHAAPVEGHSSTINPGGTGSYPNQPGQTLVPGGVL
ncbi:Ras-association [Neofusicoccum parvum]|uniref:Uncharacterized protein n=2 Tax=Neofusicoccum parvum TaxID=310453 RepID=R1G9I0_BOTPV|nr:putative protein kinase regulator ste50 protein [Neofusicoccum parvum UCRNP2]GME28217.1 Ras-association [Neofusicoccum parvum]GME44591.1 Ras-association [Neofusicoccum parvum]